MTEMEKDVMLRAVKYCTEHLGMNEAECWKRSETTVSIFWAHYFDSEVVL